MSHLPKDERKRALIYGVWGAFGFRLLALTLITFLLQSVWIKLAGGLYLLWMSVNYFFPQKKEEEGGHAISYPGRFWKTVFLVELTDITFSSDSILASVAVSHKLWVLMAGGILGILAMRFAATIFIRLMSTFPKLERSAYLLILVVASRMLLEFVDSSWLETPAARVAFWGLMGVSFLSGFLEKVEGGGTAGGPMNVLST